MKPSFTSVSRKTDMHGSYVTFMPVQSTEMSIPVKNQNVNFVGRLVSESARTFKHPLTECLKRRENRSTSRHRRWSVLPNESSWDFGRCDRFWTQLALRCFLLPTFPPGTAFKGEICRPLNHMWQIPRLLTAPNRRCQYSVRIRWLIYSKEKSFYLSYGKHWSRRLQTVRTRPAKSNIHTCMHRLYFISNFRITARANIFTAKVHSIYRYILNT